MMNLSKIRNQLDGVSVTHICDILPSVRILDIKIKPLCRENAFLTVGIAYPINAQKDILPVLRGLQQSSAGMMLVINGGGCQQALAGEIITTVAKNKQLSGIILDGYCRDYNGIISLNFPFYAKGIVPNVAPKKQLGQLNTTITCGGVTVNPGDIVVADDNGVVFLSELEYEQTIDAIKQLKAQEELAITKVSSGAGIETIINLDEVSQAMENSQEIDLNWTLD